MLRTSRYTIYVDLPGREQEVLLVHGYTGAHDRVSRRLADFLRTQEGERPYKPLYGDWTEETAAPQDAWIPGDDSVAVLKEQGYLTDLSAEEEVALFAKLAEELHAQTLQRPPSYVFMPTYDCNLRCSYCFQDHMRTDGSFRHLLRTMEIELVDRIFAAMPEIEARRGIAPASAVQRDIGFFGGEPLLAAHRPVVEHILRKAQEAGTACCWAVTNGTELAAYRDLLGPRGIARLQITFDGPAAEHDRRRIYADGSGSAARIAANVDMALAEGARVNLRINVDRRNLQDLPRLADEIIDRGWPSSPNFSAYTATIQAHNEKTEPADTFGNWELNRALVELRETWPQLAVLARPDEAIRAKAQRIFGGTGDVMPDLRASFCGAHGSMYLFDPFGEIYTCWERTGDARVSVGRITTDGGVAFRFDQMKVWSSRTVASNPVCRRCRYALHCGGGCAILALAQHGTLHANHCDHFATRFRNNVAEAYLAHQVGSQGRNTERQFCDR
jgi:uncharacterized protein